MTESERSRESLPALEDLLVSEFRTYQFLVGVTKEERTALAGADAHALTALVDQKEALLDEIGRLQGSRSRLLSAALDTPNPTVAEVLPELDPALARRVDRLCKGILALVAELRELTRGNRALAATALDYLGDIRNFLLTIDGLGMGYSPLGALPVPDTPLTWEVERQA